MDEQQQESGKTERKPHTIQRKPIRRISHLRKKSSPFWLHDVDGTRRNGKGHATGMLVVKGLVAFTLLVVFFTLLVVFCMLTESKDSWLHEQTGKAIDFYRNLTGDNVVREWEWER